MSSITQLEYIILYYVGMFIQAHVLTSSSSILIPNIEIPMIIHNQKHNFDHMATLPKVSQRLMINTCYYGGM